MLCLHWLLPVTAWSEPAPLRTFRLPHCQDDNGACYVYAYGDQMVADMWLALENEGRARFAPMFSSFNPTDLSAIDHVRRMYEKYPKVRACGCGEYLKIRECECECV